jgi:phenylacetate-CoA ligase
MKILSPISRIGEIEKRKMFLRYPYYLLELRKNQWLKTPDIEEIQKKKLRALIKHAYSNVPYYHNLFDAANIKPDDIKTVEDLSKIPITTKSQVQCAGCEIMVEDIDMNKCEKHRTSGSTGKPLTIVSYKEDRAFSKMVNARTFFENGRRLRDRTAYITWQGHSPNKCKSLLQYMGVMKSDSVSIYNDLSDQIELLKKIAPDILVGYPSSIKLLAMAVQEKEIKEIDPRLVFSSSELLDTETRNFINAVFGVNVFDCYASEEGSYMAWECKEHSGYHINMDTVVLEFIKDNERVAAGERGEIVLTNLHLYAMPFIRYKLGDVGVPSEEKCPCGRGLPLMDKIEGRADDFIVLPSGKIISPRNINLLEYADGIMSYKIIQEKRDKITVQLVKAKDFSQNTITEVKEIIKRGLLGEEINVEVEIVDEIPKDPSGKIRSVISKVQHA